ncbi:MAG: RNA polymerase sigma factor [Planctomycetota bacterium]
MRDRIQDLLAFLERSGPRLHALLTRLTLCEDMAEDLLQELFIKLSRSGGFARAANRESYACRAAINLALDWRRGQKRNPHPVRLTDDLAGDERSPLRTLIHREDLEQVLEAASKLNDLRREVFIMRHIQQESYEVIGEQLGKTVHQVRGIGHKAMEQIRGLVNQGRSQFSRKGACRVRN